MTRIRTATRTKRSFSSSGWTQGLVQSSAEVLRECRTLLYETFRAPLTMLQPTTNSEPHFSRCFLSDVIGSLFLVGSRKRENAAWTFCCMAFNARFLHIFPRKGGRCGTCYLRVAFFVYTSMRVDTPGKMRHELDDAKMIRLCLHRRVFWRHVAVNARWWTNRNGGAELVDD